MSIRSRIAASAKAGRLTRALLVFAVLVVAIPAVGAGWVFPRKPSSSKPELSFQAVQKASSVLASQQKTAGRIDPALPSLVDRQKAKLQTAEELLSLQTQNTGDPFKAAYQAAKISSRQEADLLGADLQTPLKPPAKAVSHRSIEQLATELMDRHGVSPTPAQASQIQALERLSGPVRQSLTGVLEAFLSFDRAAQEAYSRMDRAELDRALGRLVDPGPPAGPEAAEQGADSQVATPASGPSSASLTEIVDLELVLASRARLFDAAMELAQALQDKQKAVAEKGIVPMRLAQTQPTTPLCPDLHVDGVVCIDFSPRDNNGGVNTGPYTQHYVLQIDAGGNDLYYNNAGGSGDVAASTSGVGAGRAAAALMDFGGNDAYGDPANPKDKGVNGGGYSGAGFLADFWGTDVYTAGNAAGNQGVNGGGTLGGSGFLYDAAGDDHYRSLGFLAGNALPRTPVNNPGNSTGILSGGSNGGAVVGTGLLVDGRGSDQYVGMNGGANGPASGHLVDYLDGTDLYSDGSNEARDGSDDAHTFGSSPIRSANGGGAVDGASGYLYDGGGGDHYHTAAPAIQPYGFGRQEYWSTNGSGYVGSSGFLFDSSGNDAYHGYNGAGFAAAGSLIDRAGDDTYVSPRALAGSPEGSAYGNGHAILGTGLLLDAKGNDYYQDPGIYDDPTQAAVNDPPVTQTPRSCSNCTVVPKPTVESPLYSHGAGAQIDQTIEDPVPVPSAPPLPNPFPSPSATAEPTPDPLPTLNPEPLPTLGPTPNAPGVSIVSIQSLGKAREHNAAPVTFARFELKVVQDARQENEAIVIPYTTRDGTAKAANPPETPDYVRSRGQIVIEPGEDSVIFTVRVLDDTVPEVDEDFFLQMTATVNATWPNNSDGSAKATIESNDEPDD